MSDSGTFLVTHADADSAVLRNAATGQVHALSENPDLDVGDVVEGDVEQDESGVAWTLAEKRAQWTPTIERVSAAPGSDAIAAAAGESDRAAVLDREDGEEHAIPVPAGESDRAAAEVREDEAVLLRAARLGARRVEICAGEGVVSVRYRR